MDFRDIKPGMILAVHRRTYYFLFFIKNKKTETVFSKEIILPNRTDVPIIYIENHQINRDTWDDRHDYINSVIADSTYFRGFIKGVFR